MASRRAAAVDRTPPDSDAEVRRPAAAAASGSNRLDFYEALADFRRMFPSMSDEVIEAVLRANDGMVEATIDQLLTMSADAAPPLSSSPPPSPPPGGHREDRHDPHLATSLVLIDMPQQQQQRASSPSSMILPAESSRLPSTLLPLDGIDDGSISDLMLQLSAPDRSVSPSLATAAAAAASADTSLRLAPVVTASITAAAATHALGTSQQKLPPSRQFEDPFADLFAESNQPKTGSQSVSSSSEQQQQQCASGSPLASQQRPQTAAEPGRQQVNPHEVQSSASTPLVAPTAARLHDNSRSAVASGLPQPEPSGSVHRPPKPLGISLSLPLSGSQQQRCGSGAASDLSPHSSSSSSSLAESGEHDGLGRRDRERADSLRLSPSGALTAAGDGRRLLTLPLGTTNFASSSSTRESSGISGALGATGRSSPQPRPTRLSPCSGAGVHCSSPGSGDLSPGEIVDLLERDDEPPPSLPPPRLRGSAGKSSSSSSSREQQQQRRQQQQQLSGSVGSAAVVSSGTAGGGDCAGFLPPKVLAAAARWSVPLVGPLPYHFLRLCDDDQLPPPPRPPKPHGKLSLLGHDDVAASSKPALPSHVHHDGQQRIPASRSRSQRNALIIGALVADREGASGRDQRDSAAAAASAASSSSSLEPGARAKGHSSTLPAHQHSSSSSGGSSSSSAVGPDELSCRGEGGVVPKQKHRRRLPGERLSTNEMKKRIAENERRIKETCDMEDLDEETVRYLEDERLALIMQNEEFLREVKRNEDFMRTLEFEQQLLEARLTVDKSRRLAAVQSRAAARTTDAFARRSSEVDNSATTVSLAALQQPAAAAAAAAGASSSSSSPPAAAADSPSGLRGTGSSWSPAGLSASSDPKLSAEASNSSSVHSSRSWASERLPMPLPASGNGGGNSGSSSYAGPGSSGGVGGGTQSNSGSAESPTAAGRADASGGGGTEIAAADFRRQLQTMGTSSKKKFAVLAKNFFTRKVRRTHHSHNPTGLSKTPLGPSMLNLLDDCDDEDVELEEDNDANTCTNASSSSAPPAAATTHRATYDY